MENKILIFVPDLDKVGGVSNYYRTLNLQNISNINYFEGDFKTSKSVNKVKHFFKKVFKIFPEIFNNKTIVLNPSFQKNALIRDGAILCIAHLMRKNTAVFFRGWNEGVEIKILNSSFLRTAFKFVYGRVDNFITLGDVFNKKLSTLLNKPENELTFYKETTIVNNGELEYNKKEFSSELNFLFIGRITKDKVLQNLIFFNEIQKQLTEKKMNFHVAGSGEFFDELKQYILSENIKNVTLYGTVRGEEKRNLFKKCNMFLFLSRHGEGMPNSVLEAMYCGMPVICSKSGALEEIIKDYEEGLKVEIENFDVLNTIQFIENTSKLGQISLHNHTTALNNYTLDVVRKRFLKLINDINNG